MRSIKYKDKKYDNLEGYEYVDIEYDSYDYKALPGKTKLDKIKVGTKVCRYAQFPNNEKAIMPSILQELLGARKATRTLIKYKTVELESGEKVSSELKSTEHEASGENSTDTRGSRFISKMDNHLKKKFSEKR